MNVYQSVVVTFALSAIAVSLWAIWAVVRSPDLRFKPMWIIGSYSALLA
jgi:hypothetical protein